MTPGSSARRQPSPLLRSLRLWVRRMPRGLPPPVALLPIWRQGVEAAVSSGSGEGREMAARLASLHVGLLEGRLGALEEESRTGEPSDVVGLAADAARLWSDLADATVLGAVPMSLEPLAGRLGELQSSLSRNTRDVVPIDAAPLAPMSALTDTHQALFERTAAFLAGLLGFAGRFAIGKWPAIDQPLVADEVPDIDLSDLPGFDADFATPVWPSDAVQPRVGSSASPPERLAAVGRGRHSVPRRLAVTPEVANPAEASLSLDLASPTAFGANLLPGPARLDAMRARPTGLLSGTSVSRAAVVSRARSLAFRPLGPSRIATTVPISAKSAAIQRSTFGRPLGQSSLALARVGSPSDVANSASVESRSLPPLAPLGLESIRVAGQGEPFPTTGRMEPFPSAVRVEPRILSNLIEPAVPRETGLTVDRPSPTDGPLSNRMYQRSALDPLFPLTLVEPLIVEDRPSVMAVDHGVSFGAIAEPEIGGFGQFATVSPRLPLSRAVPTPSPVETRYPRGTSQPSGITPEPRRSLIETRLPDRRPTNLIALRRSPFSTPSEAHRPTLRAFPATRIALRFTRIGGAVRPHRDVSELAAPPGQDPSKPVTTRGAAAGPGRDQVGLRSPGNPLFSLSLAPPALEDVTPIPTGETDRLGALVQSQMREFPLLGPVPETSRSIPRVAIDTFVPRSNLRIDPGLSKGNTDTELPDTRAGQLPDARGTQPFQADPIGRGIGEARDLSSPALHGTPGSPFSASQTRAERSVDADESVDPVTMASARPIRTLEAQPPIISRNRPRPGSVSAPLVSPRSTEVAAKPAPGLRPFSGTPLAAVGAARRDLIDVPEATEQDVPVSDQPPAMFPSGMTSGGTLPRRPFSQLAHSLTALPLAILAPSSAPEVVAREVTPLGAKATVTSETAVGTTGQTAIVARQLFEPGSRRLSRRGDDPREAVGHHETKTDLEVGEIRSNLAKDRGASRRLSSIWTLPGVAEPSLAVTLADRMEPEIVPAMPTISPFKVALNLAIPQTDIRDDGAEPDRRVDDRTEGARVDVAPWANAALPEAETLPMRPSLAESIADSVGPAASLAQHRVPLVNPVSSSVADLGEQRTNDAATRPLGHFPGAGAVREPISTDWIEPVEQSAGPGQTVKLTNAFPSPNLALPRAALGAVARSVEAPSQAASPTPLDARWGRPELPLVVLPETMLNRPDATRVASIPIDSGGTLIPFHSMPMPASGPPALQLARASPSLGQPVSSTTIQRAAADPPAASPPPAVSGTASSVASSPPAESKPAGSDLDGLARQVLTIVKQRLAIERERSGPGRGLRSW